MLTDRHSNCSCFLLQSNPVKHTNKLDDQLAYLKFFIVQIAEAQRVQKKDDNVSQETKDAKKNDKKKKKEKNKDSALRAKEVRFVISL